MGTVTREDAGNALQLLSESTASREEDLKDFDQKGDRTETDEKSDSPCPISDEFIEEREAEGFMQLTKLSNDCRAQEHLSHCQRNSRKTMEYWTWLSLNISMQRRFLYGVDHFETCFELGCFGAHVQSEGPNLPTHGDCWVRCCHNLFPNRGRCRMRITVCNGEAIFPFNHFWVAQVCSMSST